MSYYSDVALVTTKQGWKLIEKAVKATPDGNYVLGDTDLTTYHNNKYTVYQKSGIKWYETSFPEVKAFMDELNYLEELGIPFRYARIGEDDTDVERREFDGEDWRLVTDMPNLWVQRTIEIE